ncbi:MAG: hypothetical protein JXM70_09485 [Pirellulales bacterium]|nr:hypothetical protein [Pirellulales bacterium]
MLKKISLPKKPLLIILILLLSLDTSVSAAKATNPKTPRLIPVGKNIIFEAEDAQRDESRTMVVEQSSFRSKKGVSLKEKVKQNTDLKSDASPDLIFNVRSEVPGLYVLQTHAATNAQGTARMKKASRKEESLFLKIQIDRQRPTRRVVFVPWRQPESCYQNLGKFELNGKEQQIKVWLPEGVILERLAIFPHRSPKVPKAAQNYQPSIIPPATHPRIFVTQKSLPQVRRNLELGENKPVWEALKKRALKPFPFNPTPGVEISYNGELETAAREKAFYYLMTGDEAIGKEAISLIQRYIQLVEFGNLLDITREVGRAIYSASLVYDWCYAIMNQGQREEIRKGLMRLAIDMECGWPPFRQYIVTGHGGEAQINRDLLSMGIAIYDEDPLPYRYCAYRILEVLIPMRAMQYDSPRHNQGTGYGSYRFKWEMHAAWILRRLAGREVFAPNIKNVHNFWLHMRTPGGSMFLDGDGAPFGAYWKYETLALLCSSYAADPVLKGEWLRQDGQNEDPLLVLLLNDPNLRAESSLESLPTTIDFGPMLGGMNARTGWDIGPGSSEAAVAIRGGGYHFYYHQHDEAGSFQLFYRGMQVADLGQYRFYGTPYDMNFNKRAVAHSMMLIRDPNVEGVQAKDGGTRIPRSIPRTPKNIQKDPQYNYGTVLACSFGPSQHRPTYNYFSVDIAKAYGDHVEKFTRSFCFLNLNNPKRPAALIVLDHLTTANPDAEKIWQINTFTRPELSETGAILVNSTRIVKGIPSLIHPAPSSDKSVGNGEETLLGRVYLTMLQPAPENLSVELLTGTDSIKVFGTQYDSPPGKKLGHEQSRLMYRPKNPEKSNSFLAVMQVVDGDTPPLPVRKISAKGMQGIILDKRVIAMSDSTEPVGQGFTMNLPEGKTYHILLAGLKPGTWSISGPKTLSAKVLPKKQTLFFQGEGGSYKIHPTPH